MLAVIKNFYIVKVLKDSTNEPLGTVLFGEVVFDETYRFKSGHLLCTSLIKSISPETRTVITESDSRYLLADEEGKKATVFVSEINLLRNGFTPTNVCALRNSDT